MPGYLKVDGSQRPVVAPYVKVNGNWQPVALGYTKVDGVWKIWHSAEIVDNFNRANNANLGTASNTFSQWNELSGNWAIQNNQAFYDGSAGPGIAFTQLYKASTDYKVTIDTPSNTGLGVSFWVQDNNNWHAAIPGSRQQDNPSFYSCPSGFTLQGTNCQRTESVSTLFEGPSFSNPESVPIFSYSCSSGQLNSFNNCVTNTDVGPATATTTTTYSCPDGGAPSGTNRCDTPRACNCFTTTIVNSLKPGQCAAAGGSSSGTGPDNYTCTTNRVSCECAGTGTSCKSGQPCGNEFSFATPTTTTTRTCSTGQVSGTRCISPTTTPAQQRQTGTNFVCPSGCPPTRNSGVTQCRCPGRGTYCASGVTPTGNQCITTFNQAASFTPASTSYPSVIRIFRNLNGTITQVFAQDVSSDPRSMEVSTSGANISVALYSAAGLGGSRIASVVHNSGSSIRTRGVGIAKNGNQVQRQGSSIDNFRAE